MNVRDSIKAVATCRRKAPSNSRLVLLAFVLSAALLECALASAADPIQTPLPPPPPVASNEPAYFIDLASALKLAERSNPTVAIAREAIVQNLALQEQARALLLPTLSAGGNIHIHRGPLQRDTGDILNVDSQSIYYGGGAAAVGGGTVGVPAVRIIAPLGDALLEPLIARQRVTQAEFDSRATSNSVLLDVANRYVDLMGAEARFRAERQSESDLSQLLSAVAAFVKVGQARRSDSDRVQTRSLLVRNEVYRTQEAMGVASARLARTLDLDPSVQLHTVAVAIEPIQLVDSSYDLPSLIEIALRCRPEMAASGLSIEVDRTRLRQERLRPFLPTLSLGYSAGEFGGGSNLAPPALGQFAGRSDFDVSAIWTLQNGGMGNRAAEHVRQSEVDQAVIDRSRTIDRVRHEVADAFALSAARRRQIDLTRQQEDTAETGFREEVIRTHGGEGLPIEAVNSFDLTDRARQQFVQAVVDYDQAQFQLFVALGNPPTVALPDIVVPASSVAPR